MIEWAALFCVPKYLVTDGGTHFVNQLVESLVTQFRSAHHVTTPYAPWANGVIERVNREILRLWRVLLSETALAESKCRVLRPLVQAILNRTANAAFDGLSPVEIHLARKVAIHLDTVACAGLSTAEQTTLEEFLRQRRYVLPLMQRRQLCRRTGYAWRRYASDDLNRT